MQTWWMLFYKTHVVLNNLYCTSCKVLQQYCQQNCVYALHLMHIEVRAYFLVAKEDECIYDIWGILCAYCLSLNINFTSRVLRDCELSVSNMFHTNI